MKSTLHLPQSGAEVEPAKVRFVRVKFPSPNPKAKEYTYRVELDADVRPGQYAITRRNLSQVTITAVDVAPVPNLDLSRYDFVDPVPQEEPEGLDESPGYETPEGIE